LKQIEGFNVVHEVVRIPTTYVNEQFMIQHQIDLVVAGDDYSTEPKKSQFYGDPVRLGKFVNFPRTPGISTTDIIARAVFHSLDRIKEDLKCRLNTPEEKETDPQDFQIVEAFEGLLNRYLKRPTP
jgi:glycerol-3-phosphate cytidylyltransferase-like family protein